MHVIRAMNVNDAYQQGVRLFGAGKVFDAEGLYPRNGQPLPIKLGSRGGEVDMWPEPVCTVYSFPMECVLWDAKRDCNPFFHLFESLWMLAGQNDVAYLDQFNKQMAKYSDDGDVFHGAYGFRWREWYGIDQLFEVGEMLRKDPTTRRAVLQMWSPNGDLVSSEGAGGQSCKDLPCNLSVVFNCRATGTLEMTVYNRSNDMIFGAYGANAVHFSFLHQWMAAYIGKDVGAYRQVANDFHVYSAVWEDKVRPDLSVDEDLYNTVAGASVLVSRDESVELFDTENMELVLGGNHDPARYGNLFLRNIAAPLLGVWQAWKAKDRGRALALLREAEAGRPLGQLPDWFIACGMWMGRRASK